jgi:S-DNA-T family DNA segregation ATPase FtsK/SpoIIIE
MMPSAPHTVLRPKRPELAAAVAQLAQEILGRTGEEPPEAAPITFLIVANLQDFKQLRQEDDFSLGSSETMSPAAAFLNLITDGPARGCHVIASIDTYSNVSRCLGRKALSEFQSRVLFQMGASDSASLIDSPEASKLGFHRALLFNEREGYVEKFRPYALTGSG